MATHIRLNRKDERFCTNIYRNYISVDVPISLSQANVVDIIISKYKKQLLNDFNLNSETLIQLEWKMELLSLDDIKKKSYLDIRDEELVMSFRMQKHVIKDLRSLIHDALESFNLVDYVYVHSKIKIDFNWSFERKEWNGKFNVLLLKMLHTFAQRNGINISNKVQELVNQFEALGEKSLWEPSLKVVNDRWYINNIAETMQEHVSILDQTNISPSNMENLANTFGLKLLDTYGITKAFILDKDVSITLADVDMVIKYCKIFDKVVYINVHNSIIEDEIVRKCNNESVKCYVVGNGDDFDDFYGDFILIETLYNINIKLIKMGNRRIKSFTIIEESQ